MKVTETRIRGLCVIDPKVFGDERGFFMETYSAGAFKEAGLPTEFVQDNFSRSAKGILRGLHFQRPPFAQGKLVRVTAGAVFDVAVDLRHGSPTFGQYEAVELSAENKRSFYIPEGFAHGFYVLSESADFQYKCTQVYAPDHDDGIVWNDAEIGIAWPGKDPVLSKKDAGLGTLKDFRAKKTRFL